MSHRRALDRALQAASPAQDGLEVAAAEDRTHTMRRPRTRSTRQDRLQVPQRGLASTQDSGLALLSVGSVHTFSTVTNVSGLLRTIGSTIASSGRRRQHRLAQLIHLVGGMIVARAHRTSVR